MAGGDRKALDRATSAQREATRELMRAAVEAAEAGDVGTGAAFEEKVGATLRAAAADADVAEQLVAGRLVREQEAVGLFGFDAAGPRPLARARRPGSAVPRGRRARRPARARTRAPRPRAEKRPRRGGAPRRGSARGSARWRRHARRSSGLAALPTPPSGPRRRSARRPSARWSGSRRPSATRRAPGRSSRRLWPSSSASIRKAPSREGPAQPAVCTTTASICLWPRLPGYTGPAALIRSPGPGSGLGRRSVRTSMIDSPGAVIDSLRQQHEMGVPVAVGIHALHVEDAAAGRSAVGETGRAGRRLQVIGGRGRPPAEALRGRSDDRSLVGVPAAAAQQGRRDGRPMPMAARALTRSAP